MKVVKKSMIAKQDKIRYIFTERDALIQVLFLKISASTLLSSKLCVRFKIKPNSTLFWSTVPEESYTTYWQSRKNSQSSSNSELIQSQVLRIPDRIGPRLPPQQRHCLSRPETLKHHDQPQGLH